MIFWILLAASLVAPLYLVALAAQSAMINVITKFAQREITEAFLARRAAEREALPASVKLLASRQIS